MSKMAVLFKQSAYYSLVIVIGAFLFTCFYTERSFFDSLVTAKQWGLERVVLYSVPLFIGWLFLLRQIQIHVIDVLVFAFVVLHSIGHFSSAHSTLNSVSQSLYSSFFWLYLYLMVRLFTKRDSFLCGVVIAYMAVSALQSCLGLLQLHGLEHSFHGLFSVTGTFHNPGPFSGFIVSALPLALGIICYTEIEQINFSLKRRVGDRVEMENDINFSWFRIKALISSVFKVLILSLAWITVIAILLVLPPAQSRAAWVAAILGSIFVLARHPMVVVFRMKQEKKFYSFRKPIRFLILIAIFSVIVMSGLGLYTMKKGSADGRLLMWQVSTQIIKQKPLTGHGTSAFNALYMNEQANWFASGKGTEAQAMVAGSPEAPFNELLKLWLEKGLIALLLAGGILYIIFFKKQTPNPQLSTIIKAALLSLLTFSLFSYPFDISSLTLQLVVLLGILAAESNTVISIKGIKTYFITIPAAVLLVLATIYYVPQRQAYYQAMKTWQQADRFYSMRSYTIASEAYAEAFPALQTNGLFLQMYGKALSMDEQHQESNEILKLAQQRYSSQIIQNTLGDNHKALGNYPEAEAAYIKSAHMIPSLLLPKYLLAKLYVESGQHQKAQKTAEEILNSPVRVESSATREIMNEMRSVISDQ